MGRLAILMTSLLAMMTTAMADEIKVNEPFEGKFPSEAEEVRGAPGGGRGAPGTKVHRATVDVALEEGHTPSVTVTAEGAGRKVAIVVLDQDGKPVATNLLVQKKSGPAALQEWKDGGASRFVIAAAGGGQRLGPTAEAKIPAVPVGGTYTIVLLSTYPGKYTLTVKDPKAKRPATARRGAADIQREIEATRRKLAELEAELKAIGRDK